MLVTGATGSRSPALPPSRPTSYDPEGQSLQWAWKPFQAQRLLVMRRSRSALASKPRTPKALWWETWRRTCPGPGQSSHGLCPLRSPQSVPGPGEAAVQRVTQSPASLRLPGPRGQEPAAPRSFGSSTLAAAAEPEVGSGRVKGSPGTQKPRRLLLAALWRHLLGTLQSARGYKLAREKWGRASAVHRRLSETAQAPSGHRLRGSNRAHSLPAGEGQRGMEGRARPQRRGEGQGDSSSTWVWVQNTGPRSHLHH